MQYVPRRYDGKPTVHIPISATTFINIGWCGVRRLRDRIISVNSQNMYQTDKVEKKKNAYHCGKTSTTTTTNSSVLPFSSRLVHTVFLPHSLSLSLSIRLSIFSLSTSVSRGKDWGRKNGITRDYIELSCTQTHTRAWTHNTAVSIAACVRSKRF